MGKDSREPSLFIRRLGAAGAWGPRRAPSLGDPGPASWQWAASRRLGDPEATNTGQLLGFGSECVRLRTLQMAHSPQPGHPVSTRTKTATDLRLLG